VFFVEKRNRALKNVFVMLLAVFMFMDAASFSAAEAAVYASPVAVWGYPVVAGVVPMVVSPLMISPVIVGYPWISGVYYYGAPAPGYVYSGVGYALPYTAVIIQGE
jgi:predicted membrane protein